MGKQLILVADDDRLVLATIASSLRETGFEVIEARNGQDAVDLARDKRPDLALLDINMPNMTGIEAALILKTELDVNTVFLTAYDNKALIEEAVENGALGYLVKPLDFRNILPTIKAALERSTDLKCLEKSKNDLVNALDKNRNISLAIGILMERHSISEADAFESIRVYARSKRCKILSVANELVGLVDVKSTLADSIYNQYRKNRT